MKGENEPMKPSATAGPRRKSRVNLSKHDQTAAEAVAAGSLNGNMPEEIHARIATLAYQLYEQRGRQDGHDVEDWIIAEQRVLADQSKTTR
jgi:hypothetical protein